MVQWRINWQKYYKPVVIITLGVLCCVFILFLSSGSCCVPSSCDRNGFVQIVCPGLRSDPAKYSNNAVYQSCTFIQNVLETVCQQISGKCDGNHADICLAAMTVRLQADVLERQAAAARQRHSLSVWITHLNNSDSGPRYVEVTRQCGRMGNWMFQVASVIGIGRKNQRIPLPFPGRSYYHHFSYLGLDSLIFNSDDVRQPESNITLVEKGIATFTENLTSLAASSYPRNVLLSQCMQSFKYFIDIQDQIRFLFTFGNYDLAVERIVSSIRKRKWINDLQSVPLTVGIHVRGGDFFSNESLSTGLVPPPAEYYNHAVSYLESKVKQPLVYFVLSDDFRYSKKILPDRKFYVLPGITATQDMAVLQLMDFVIISAGSFGWWSAFSSQAKEVIYYRNWPAPNSSLSAQFPPGDYYLPQWTGML